MVNQEAFERAKEKIIGYERQRQGIGTLSEKTVHAVLKLYYAPDEDMHEIPIENYVADIFTGSEIVEIQTRNMNRMRAKLDAFLPLFPVTVVYPIPRNKWLIWMNEESGECTNKRKSPVIGNAYYAFPELYKIKGFLTSPNLRLRFPLIDIEEYRLLNGWSKDRKKGSSRYDRIPVCFEEEVVIERTEDYMQFIPYELAEPFTVADFAKQAKIKKDLAGIVLHILNYVGVLEHIGKAGKSYLYRVVDI